MSEKLDDLQGTTEKMAEDSGSKDRSSSERREDSGDENDQQQQQQSAPVTIDGINLEDITTFTFQYCIVSAKDMPNG
ncbi:unnamed protein product [Trichobilharzia regenti]|nr:unnamed protein product [Trichobilharzia regenti]